MKTSLARSLLTTFIILTATACNSLNSTSSGDEKRFSDLDAGWNEFSASGKTTCSDGSPYKFFVRPGASEKLMVYMQGGGGCWTRDSCDPEMNPSYTQNISDEFKPSPFGIFNFDNAENPFVDYTIVMAPYCTGDVHLGQSDTVYAPVKEGQQPLKIHHQGRTNMQAVLDWTYANVTAPEKIFVTGSSAGAIPSPFYAALVADNYPQANVAQLGDAAGGYRRLNGSTRPDEQWGTFNYIKNEKGFEDLDAKSFNYEKLYMAAANRHPKILFAEYDAAEDAVQKRFLAMGGIQNVQLIDSLKANHSDILQAAANFRSFIAGGESHTVLLRPEFYAYGADGVSIRNWVYDLAQFEDVSNVTCQACSSDTYAGYAADATFMPLWQTWQSKEQYVKPFKIFDNVYYVGIDWVAAYLIETSEGLILIDSLYGSWVRPLINNIQQLGFDPADVKYVINTHGHFDHAGGSKYFQAVHGARIVMTVEDWALAESKPLASMFYMPVPTRDIIANDGDVITLGDTNITLYNTPGHTEGVLSMTYQVKDGNDVHTAMTLGGVGLNFNGVEQTQSYIDSYLRLQSMQDGISVSLPNHAFMAGVFERAEQLTNRGANDPHPFVDPDAYQASLATIVKNAQAKLSKEKSGDATSSVDELIKAVSN